MAERWGTTLRIFKNRTRFFRIRTLFRIYRTLSFTPVVASLAIFFVLWLPPQMQEVYASLLTDPTFVTGPRSIWQALFGLFLICFVSILLFCWHLFYSWPRIDRLYREYPYLNFDRALLSICVNKASLLALTPFLGLIFGLIGLRDWATRTKAIVGQDNGAAPTGLIDRLTQLSRTSGYDLTKDWKNLSAQLEALEQNSLIAVAVTLAAAAIVLLITKRIASPRLRAKQGMLWLSTAVAMAALILPLIDAAFTVKIAWMVGPLAAVATVFISTIAILCWLSIASWQLKFPFIPVLVVIAIVTVGIRIQGNVGPKVAAKQTTGLTPIVLDECRRATSEILQTNNGEISQSSESDRRRSMVDSCKIISTFKSWLDNRLDKGIFRDKPYPVFIVAAQGGGIYASAAAAQFLSSMEDDCPSFAQHVFTVSAVSGGSVGTAIFNALHDPQSSQEPSCNYGPNRQFSDASQEVLLHDHLSPVISMIVPDILRKLPLLHGLQEDKNRASLLEESLAQAIMLKSKHNLDSQTAVERWKPTHQNPMPVLNTTWVENGYRVAFSPVPLNEISDGTLFSFKELSERLGGASVLDKPLSSASLVREAVVSARFPLISSAWNIPSFATAHWNFVDGGYSDNSGVTTAVEIYKALNNYSKQEPSVKFDLRLIILNNTQPDFSPERIDGSNFSDIGAPISALLSVRSQMAGRAITSAIDQIEPAKRANAQLFNGRDPETHVMFVQLEQRTFPLSLGWKISPEEHELVKLLLGDPRLAGNPGSIGWPDICQPKTTPQSAAQTVKDPLKSEILGETEITLDTIVGNSCVKFNIARLLLHQGNGS